MNATFSTTCLRTCRAAREASKRKLLPTHWMRRSAIWKRRFPIATQPLSNADGPKEKTVRMKMEKIALTQSQMNLMLVAVEHGFKQCEKGLNLEAALVSVFDLYE